jgi:opacity protein-like surface antigen
MKKLLLLGLSALAASGSAHAWEPTYYAGSGVTWWQFGTHGLSGTLTIGALEGLAGIEFSPYTAAEVRIGAGMNSGRRRYVETTFEIETPYFASVYFKPQLRNETASLYGLLGATTIEVNGSFSPSVPDLNNQVGDTYTDLSYGLGVSFVASQHCDVTLEWKKLIAAEDFDMRGGTIGFNYRF